MRAKVKAGNDGEMEVPLDAEQFRTRGTFRVTVSSLPEMIEKEPNSMPGSPNPLPVPGAVNGHFESVPTSAGQFGSVKEDYFSFTARASQPLLIETFAQRRGSPADTRIEVLFPDGRPVPRLLFQAVRNTAINFRSADSNNNGLRLDHYEEMELNELVWLNGDILKIFRMPQGPDSDMLFYANSSKRRAWFDTTAVGHSLDEPGFIVEPRPVGTQLVPNGLPVFTLNYANDDDGERRLGTDSRLYFTAPAEGTYLVRVTESRGQGGGPLPEENRYTYRLVIREPKPDFTTGVAIGNSTVPPGSGRGFSVTAERFDGFEGPITVTISNLPPGFTASTPLVIEAGHSEAKGTIFAATDAPAVAATNESSSVVIAMAVLNGRAVSKPINNLGKLKLATAQKLYVTLEPFHSAATNAYNPSNPPPPLEITLAPGQTVSAWLKVKRDGLDEVLTFSVDDLPHGVIVDNLGLNGITFLKGENEREIFLSCAPWVAEMDRYCHAIVNQADKPTSRPVLLKIRKAGTTAAK